MESQHWKDNVLAMNGLRILLQLTIVEGNVRKIVIYHYIMKEKAGGE